MEPKEFLESIKNLNYIERDRLCSEYCLDSNNISFTLNNFKKITVTDKDNTLEYLVSSDSLCIGDKDNRIRLPLSGPRAQVVLDKYHCILPTKKMSDQIWKSAEIKLEPKPRPGPYDSSMFSIEAIIIHSEKIDKQLIGKDSSLLIAGHKKDVVITNKLAPNNPNKRLAIYGWHRLNGEAIQGPTVNFSVHEREYFDYSHHVRLVSKDCMLNGEVKDICSILESSEYSHLISDEGKLSFLGY